MNKLDEYLEQDIWTPKYLFHGSPYEIDILEPRKSVDTQNKENEDHAVFLTSSFINATAYAFRNKLKEMNEHYDFSMNHNGKLLAMIFQVDNLPDNLYGYIYVFKKNEDIIKDAHSGTTQYRCYHELRPIDIVKVYFKEFADNFARSLLESERIYYTQMSECLVDDYLRMYNNPEIQKLLYGKEKKFKKEQILKWIKISLEQKKPIFSMIEKGTNDFLGTIEIISKENGMGELAISLMPDKQGKGYGQEAINTILKYGYEKLNLNVYKSNQNAINCYSRNGFIITGDGYKEDDVHMKHKR